MTEPNKRVVQGRHDGNLKTRWPGADRTVAATPKQDARIIRALDTLRIEDGGKLQFRLLGGSLREQDVSPVGNDPRSSRGRKESQR